MLRRFSKKLSFCQTLSFFTQGWCLQRIWVNLQRLGIPEYWIVDYLTMEGRELLGKPKMPTVSVHLRNQESKA